MSESATPMMQQYRELKARDPEALLLFRMGDFYEMFGDDAERAAPLLGLALTTRDKGPDALSMAGFPHHQLETYLAKIVAAGLRAAVCEQMEDARFAKGLVKRDVVRVVTPGTLTDDELLDPKRANYLAAVVETSSKMGLAWVDLSTGRFSLTAVLKTELFEELARIQPVETLISELAIDSPWSRQIRARRETAVTVRPSWDFQPAQALGVLCDLLRVTTLAGFGIEDKGPEVQAAGALAAYLKETQKTELGHIRKLTPYRRSDALGLDETTRRSLELTRTLREGKREGSLLAMIDRTATPMGARMLAEWLSSPLTSIELIEQRQGAVAELVRDAEARAAFRQDFANAYDLERLASRVGAGRANPRDLAALGRTLALLPRIKARLAARHSTRLRQLEAALELCPEVRDAIDAALVDDPPLTVKEGGMIKPGYHAELDELRDQAHGGKSWIARFQAEQIRQTGIPNLKVAFNKVFGYYIEITHAQAQARGATIPPNYIRKQTVKNAERYITPELKEYEDKVLRAQERACDLEYELFTTLRDRVSAESPRLIQAGLVLAQLDALCSLAELAVRQGYCQPQMAAEPVFEVDAGRHPVLDLMLPAGSFVPNDIRLGGEHGNILLITGPNMAGKSTYIRQTALIAVLAQIGSFVPAKRALIGVVDRLFARVGAADDLGRGQSTFMVEMTETANILHNATPHSLVVLDEIGRGTSTFDGVSLAWAIAEHLHDQVGCRTLFATHYHELVELEKTRPRLRNASVQVHEQAGEIVFLYRVEPGGADQSYGIHVARLAGVPAAVLDRAREILAFLEKQHGPDPGMPEGPIKRKVKSARALQGSLFAALPDPLLVELRNLDPSQITPDQALELIKQLKNLAD